jgi:hypothetical protein
VRDELLFHYSQELTYLRYLGAEFANKYPKVAGRLLLEAGKCEDPHVERLLEGFAFLAARIHTKIDDEFPEVIESLLSVLYPYYLRPIPSAVGGAVPSRPGTGKAHERPADPARIAALLGAGGRHAVQIPDRATTPPCGRSKSNPPIGGRPTGSNRPRHRAAPRR